MSNLRRFPYILADVFAERPLQGNMLALFTDARGLTGDEMQRLARETNLSETAFIFPDDPADEAGDAVRVRIFTTAEELPFAGHPALGTAAWLYQCRPVWRGREEIALALKGGPVTVRFDAPAEGELGVFGSMRQRDPAFGALHDPEEVSRATGMAWTDLDTTLPIQTVSTGLPFCLVPVRTLEAIGRLQIPRAASEAYLAKSDAKFFYFFTRSLPASDADFHARMQFLSGEDPATGSASGCAISYLVRYGLVPSGRRTVLEQGAEILRNSRIVVSARLTDGAVGHVFVGGRTIFVASGEFLLPFDEGFPQKNVTERKQS